MPVKVSAKLNLKGIPDEIKKEMFRKQSEKRAVEASIVEEMVQGRSPVKGKKWKKYSASYAKKKRGNESDTTPVDMTVTGDLIKSLKLIKQRNGEFIVKFKGQAVLARYHDFSGAGKSKVIRRLLPRESGEEFKRSIQKVIDLMITVAVFRVISRVNK